ncbi:MAG TPA: S41 family peptidase [Vicinamibacterales bacterium]|nr:S41 family peptidase [Vicinamibacterales bacterium]
MTFRTRMSVLLLSTPVLAFVLIGGLMGNASADTQDDKIRTLRVFDDVVSLVMSNYVEEVKVDKAMEGALRGLADGLDADSAYLTPAQVAEVAAGKEPAEGDVGLELTRQYYLRVIAARDGSPAAQAGLQTGDYVRAIDGRPTRDLSVFEGVRLLRGRPGTKVVLTVIRANAAEPHEVTLVRAPAVAPPITSRMLKENVGYIRIPAFNADVAAQISSHVRGLRGARALVVDLRRTAEGNIDHGIAAARLFVPSGTIATRAARDEGAGETITARAGDGTIDLPVQVLVSAGTSGAAEVFAAALRDNKRAELVGEHTIGRAALQRLVKLPENRGLWLTYARYLAPSGAAIHGAGLKPDVPVDEPDVEFGAERPAADPVLDAALERLTRASAAGEPR